MTDVTHSPAYLDTLRTHAHDACLCALIAPEPHAPALLALAALEAELQHIAATASQPVIGLMRLAWWRDGLAECTSASAAPRPHPLLKALAPLAAQHGWNDTDWHGWVNAHEAAIEKTPFACWRDLEAFARQTAGQMAIMQAQAMGIGEHQQTIANWATAWRMADLVRTAPLAYARGWAVIPSMPDAPASWQAASPPLTEGLARIEVLLALPDHLTRSERHLLRSFLLFQRFGARYTRVIHKLYTASNFHQHRRNPLLHTALALKAALFS